MATDVYVSPAGNAKEVVEQYRQIPTQAMNDAETWLRQAALGRAMPEALPDAILITDEAGIIISVNSRFELMFGYHRSEVIGHTPEMLLPDAARTRHIRHRRDYVEHPKVREMGAGMKISARSKNGTKFRVVVNLRPVVIPAGVCTIAVIRRERD